MQQYSLGSHADELARLDQQAAVIERPTRLILQAAGLARGMRVLDLGSGLGHVARLVGELVGPEGSVLGIDRSPEMIDAARQRTKASGAAHVSFTQADVTAWRAEGSFDAIVGRLVLFHVPDPPAVVGHHVQALRPDGVFIAIDFDIGAARVEPAVDSLHEALRWVEEAFRAAGAWPRIGARLGTILDGRGLGQITTFGIQAYLQPGDPAAAGLLAGVVRSLAPIIVRERIASAAQVDLVTEAHIGEQLRSAGAVLLPPTVVGAWGRRTGG
jgi:ubiquinone/menaquinone biosynthesis C-methylase UbiE